MTFTTDILFPPVLPSSKTSGMCHSSAGRAGSSAHIRCRAVCYDEAEYEAPHIYDPERFLKDGQLDTSVKDPEDRIFGSGRRYICNLIVLRWRPPSTNTSTRFPLTEFVPEGILRSGPCSLTSPARSLYLTLHHPLVKSLRQSIAKPSSGSLWFTILAFSSALG